MSLFVKGKLGEGKAARVRLHGGLEQPKIGKFTSPGPPTRPLAHSLRSALPARYAALIRSPARSLAPELMGKRFMSMK